MSNREGYIEYMIYKKYLFMMGSLSGTLSGILWFFFIQIEVTSSCKIGVIIRILGEVIEEGRSVGAGNFDLFLVTSFTSHFATPFKPENKSLNDLNCFNDVIDLLAVAGGDHLHHLLLDVHAAVPAEAGALPDLCLAVS